MVSRAYKGTDLSEQVVARRWETQSFDSDLWRHLNMQLVFRGMPSDAGGPDYQDALFTERGKTLIRGDVEFHILSSDWYNHQHHLDPAYDNVRLHVVWREDRRPTVRHDGVHIPVLELGSDREDTTVHPGVEIDGPAFPAGCAHACKRLKHEDVIARLRRAGLDRFNERADRFEEHSLAVGPDQSLYSALFEALGYASNRRPFLLLADAVPYAWLMSRPPGERLDALLSASGLVPSERRDLPGRIDAGEWKLSRLRPANHPIRRLEGAVALLNTLESPIEQTISELVMTNTGPQELIDVFRTPNGAGGLVGHGRATEISVSVGLPSAAARADVRETALHLFLRFPSPPSNRWTRDMRDMLEKAGHPLKRQPAVLHQGMHHIYHRFCRLRKSDECILCGPSR